MMRLPWLCILGTVVTATAPRAPAADSLTSGVLSCAAESDRERRLDCYDLAVASYTAGLSNSRPASSPAPGSAAGAAAGSTVGSPRAAAGVASAPAQTKHLAAHIASINHFPDYVIVHLDNQQAWKQVADSSGALLLRNGDAVTIDKQMGSYWLAGPKGEAVQVKLQGR
jgi:hypothetical protein